MTTFDLLLQKEKMAKKRLPLKRNITNFMYGSLFTRSFYSVVMKTEGVERFKKL